MGSFHGMIEYDEDFMEIINDEVTEETKQAKPRKRHRH